MRWVILLFLFVFHQINYLHGSIAHLVVFTQEDGAVVLNDSKERSALSTARFLPPNVNISVRPRSGIETVASGFQFRFGASTRFKVESNKILLEEGSIMILSRKLENELQIESPETTTVFKGVGCSLIEVGTSGGLKIIGILGRSTIKCPASGSQESLMPGELFFHMPGSRGFGEKVNLNLGKLIKSSYLLSGFPNTPSFVESLKTTAQLQEESIGKVYAAEVGDSKNPDTFEIIPNSTPVKVTPNASEQNNSEKGKSVDPLTELLGRPSVRHMGKFVPVAEEKNENESSGRPFPSRLLRKN